MLWACMGASVRSNSSAEDQARRPEVHAWIARICASLPPKLIGTPLVCAGERVSFCAPNAAPLETSQNRRLWLCAHASEGTPHRSAQPESTSANAVAEKLGSIRDELAAGANTWARRIQPCILGKNISFASRENCQGGRNPTRVKTPLFG